MQVRPVAQWLLAWVVHAGVVALRRTAEPQAPQHGRHALSGWVQALLYTAHRAIPNAPLSVFVCLVRACVCGSRAPRQSQAGLHLRFCRHKHVQTPYS